MVMIVLFISHPFNKFYYTIDVFDVQSAKRDSRELFDISCFNSRQLLLLILPLEMLPFKVYANICACVIEEDRMKKNLIISVFLFFMICPILSAGAPGYHVIGKIALGGEGGWDYLTVDEQSDRLFVSRGSHVAVVDLKTDKQVADIPDTQGVHGIALAAKLNRGFISCGKSDEAVIFDLKTLKVLDRIKTGANPDAILYDPFTKRVFTFNGRSNDATIIDAATGNVLATLPLGGKPEFATTDGAGAVYVNIEDTSEVVTIDPAKAVVTKRCSLKPGEEPSGMALDAKRHRIYSGCGNKIMTVLDPATCAVIATIPIGAHVDGNGYDPHSGLSFSANGEGTLTVAKETSPGKYEVLETVATQRGARTMAVDSKTHRVYLPTAQYGLQPAATQDNPRPRPPVIKDTFVILVVGK
jgi:YVTN family beta-propeller protein